MKYLVVMLMVLGSKASALCPDTYGYNALGFYGGKVSRQVGISGECLMPKNATLEKPPIVQYPLVPVFRNGTWSTDYSNKFRACVVTTSNTVKCGGGISKSDIKCIAPMGSDGLYVKDMSMIKLSEGKCTFDVAADKAKKDAQEQKKLKRSTRLNDTKAAFDKVCANPSADKDKLLCALSKELLVREGKVVE